MTNMAAAMELKCWGGDWGLPSVHTDSLIVLVTLSSAHEFNKTVFVYTLCKKKKKDKDAMFVLL